MTEAAVASNIHQTLDVHRDVAAEIAFDVTVVFNFRAELLLFFLGEVFDAGIRVDPSDFYNVVRYCRPDNRKYR